MSKTATRAWRDGPWYWATCAGLISATAAILGLWLWANARIARDITEVDVVETANLFFGCEPDHFLGAGISFKQNDKKTNAVACFDPRAWRWRLKDSKDYLKN